MSDETRASRSDAARGKLKQPSSCPPPAGSSLILCDSTCFYAGTPPLPSLLPQARLRTTLPRTQKVDVRTKSTHDQTKTETSGAANRKLPRPAIPYPSHVPAQALPPSGPIRPLPVHRQTVSPTQLQTQERPETWTHTLFTYIETHAEERRRSCCAALKTSHPALRPAGTRTKETPTIRPPNPARPRPFSLHLSRNRTERRPQGLVPPLLSWFEKKKEKEK
ncbi:hypothetical protein LZ31DRAFT_27725 [Colletotrichum somersetense]|nr:hypothetical protein LZ31DRAFT_27725 [Colletotrichum somersetense]